MTQIAAIVTIAILPGMGIWIRATAGFTASCTAAHFLLVHAVRGILPGALAVSLNGRSEEHTSELQSLMRISYAVFCLKKKTNNSINTMSKQETRRRQNQ